MFEYLGICAVSASTQRRAQLDIERAGFGTRVPSFRVAFKRQGEQVQVRALFPGLVFTYLRPGYGVLNDIDGVRVLQNGDQPLRIVGNDEEKLNKLELDCLLGEFNKVQIRNAAGRYVSSEIPVSRRKQKKRKCRSISAKAERRRKRRTKRRGFGNHTDVPNQIAA